MVEPLEMEDQVEAGLLIFRVVPEAQVGLVIHHQQAHPKVIMAEPHLQTLTTDLEAEVVLHQSELLLPVHLAAGMVVLERQIQLRAFL
jgi:hypothetical protein